LTNWESVWKLDLNEYDLRHDMSLSLRLDLRKNISFLLELDLNKNTVYLLLLRERYRRAGGGERARGWVENAGSTFSDWSQTGNRSRCTCGSETGNRNLYIGESGNGSC